MSRANVVLAVSLAILAPAAATAQSLPLTIVQAKPEGEIAQLAEANEIRVVFSEPMVVLGRIPSPVVAPFFSISPAVKGTFRWSGTTILIFTPAAPLPYATPFEVAIAATAKAVSGRTLAAPHRFRFVTPTVRLLATNWYRRGGRFDEPLVIPLRFNQPVRAADVMAHLALRYERHQWTKPTLSADDRKRLEAIDPSAAAKFDAKVTTADTAAQAAGVVPVALAGDWDKKRFPPSRDLVVVQTTVAPPPESWVRVTLDPSLPSPAGKATPPSEQHYTIQNEPAFFVDGPRCLRGCDPSSYNAVSLRRAVALAEARKALGVYDVTGRGAPRKVSPSTTKEPVDYGRDESAWLTLEEAGFDRQPPARTYAVTLAAGLRAKDGQTLGYTWLGTIENWHERAFTSFGDGHGVWERTGGLLLPFYARNFTDVTQWAAPLAPNALMPTTLALQPYFTTVPEGDGLRRTLQVKPDEIQSFGLDLSRATRNGAGLVWAGVAEGTPIPQSEPIRDAGATRSTLVQVTNLGITVKDSPHALLAFVTRLDDGSPVPGARVSVIDRQNRTFWSGTTDADGVAKGPGVPLRNPRRTWDVSRVDFLVLAEKDGDVAYALDTWHEGITPWEFGIRYDLQEASPVLRGTVFADRGVYKPGEEVHFKAVLRSDTASGIEMLTPGTPVFVSISDSRSKTIDRRRLETTTWSSLEWTTTLPADAALGDYSIQAALDDPDAPRPAVPVVRPEGAEGSDDDDTAQPTYYRRVNGSFLVAAYRRPDFRVDVSLAGTPDIAGTTLKGIVSARYLFGAAMKGRPVRWTYRRSPVFGPPPTLLETFTDERYVFVGSRRDAAGDELVSSNEDTIADGELSLDLATSTSGDLPYRYSLEGDVEDVSRQHIANRNALLVHPAAFYIGVRRPPYFVDQKAGMETAIVALTPDGTPVAGVAISLTLTQVQWRSARRAEGNGFYTWETTRSEEKVGTWTATTAAAPVPMSIPLPSGGYFTLRAEATDEQGRQTATELSFYGLGSGYTAWERFDHNRITLVADRATYKPGDTAHVMIQSPWEGATALVTTEREGVRTHRRFALTSTQQSIDVPVTEADIPNVFVSVLLVRGRTKTEGGEDDGSDPGKPSFRLGYVELRVDDASKRLSVAVKASRDEYRPGAKATVDVEVKDRQGRAAQSEVTLWAVDYGVLSLTSFRTPDVLGSVYVAKALQVMTTDNRQRIISRRVLTPKGTDEGGGGGADSGVSTVRKDFRVLAFWVGSVATDGAGKARTTVTLPESLTTYRIMAVAADKGSRFGSAESEVRINKPVTLKAAFPRFLALGDRAYFGAVVTSQLKDAGTAQVTIKSLDPAVLAFGPDATASGPVTAGGSAEFRFEAMARATGRARVQVTARVGSETDAFEDVVPVEVLVSPETVAAYGQTDGRAVETLTVPAGVVPTVGGLSLELSSTAMVGLGEGARYLVEYPYGCAEQRGSRALALLLGSDLGEAFHLPGVDPSAMRSIAQFTVTELRKFQCDDGGFAYWPGDCSFTSPYLTSYLLHVFRIAGSLKYVVDAEMRERAYSYLERSLGETPPTNESWWPQYTAWQAFALKELVEGGRNQDSNLTRLYGYRDRMPIFGLAYLLDAMLAKGETGTRVEDVERRLANAVLPEGGSAHVEELSDPYLMWFWNSNVRSTAIALGALVRRPGTDPAIIRPMVRWLMTARRNGRWGNTQENAWAMEALVAYYRKYEAQVPDFTSVVSLGTDPLMSSAFKGRSAESVRKDLPMPDLVKRAATGTTRELSFSKEGTGTLFYAARLRYAADELFQDGLDSGFAIARTYAPVGDADTNATPATSFKAGDLVRVTLTLHLTKERRFIAVTDPRPAGFEPVDTRLATTSAADAGLDVGDDEGGWRSWWERGGFDHVERHDDRVLLFATRLSEGVHTYSYLVRATTVGTFRTAPSHAEEMYEPEVFGRTATAVIEVKR